MRRTCATAAATSTAIFSRATKSASWATRSPPSPPNRPAIAKQALKKIKVVYEPLPVVIDPEEATKPDAPTLHDDMPLPKTIPADAK